MGPERLQPGKTRSKHAASALTLLAVAICVGCANPGPPKPPSLHLPALVKDLEAERSGDRVLLHWTTPTRTTDDMQIKGAMTAEVCLEVGDRQATPVARATACAPVRRLAVTPGRSEVADILPPALQAEPLQLLTYRVQLFNATGHSAGDSLGSYAAAGTTLPAVESLRATASERGAVLEWRTAAATVGTTDFIDLERIDLSAPPVGKSKSPASRSPGTGKPTRAKKGDELPRGVAHLRDTDMIAGSHGDTAGTIDTTAVMGDTYTYTAQRVRVVTIGSRRLEIRSGPSAKVTLEMRDTFPPKVPTGLAAISGASPADPANASASATNAYIDLSWEPNAETDLAGYRVYRQLARPDGSPQGPLARLAELPLAAPSYRDIAVKPGQGYIYTVTAVDAAGNESAPSSKALETVSPDAGKPPQ